MLTHREEKLLRSLRRRRIREVERCFLAEGVRVTEDLLASGIAVRFAVTSSSLEDSERGSLLAAEVTRRGIPHHSVSDAELARWAQTEAPQGILVVAQIPTWSLDDLGPLREPAALLVLDAVQDPGNFGTMVRTAEALGAAGVISLPGTVDAWNAKSVRAAAGSSFRLPLVACTWAELEPWLRHRDFRSYAAAVDGQPFGSERLARSAVIVGNEGAGISDDSRARADRLVGIPLRGRAESLNVAAAAAILLYELLR